MARRVEIEASNGSECLGGPESQRVPEKKVVETWFHMASRYPSVVLGLEGLAYRVRYTIGVIVKNAL